MGEGDQACDAVQRGGLPAARRPEQGDELARPDSQVEVDQGIATAKAPTHTVQLQ